MDFEENSKLLLGERYDVMRDLAYEINDYLTTTRDFGEIPLYHLSIIDSMLESFKSLTFWYKYRPYDQKKWFSAETRSPKNKNSMIKPAQFLTKEPIEMYEEVKKIFNNALNRPVRDFTTDQLEVRNANYKKN